MQKLNTNSNNLFKALLFLCCFALGPNIANAKICEFSPAISETLHTVESGGSIAVEDLGGNHSKGFGQFVNFTKVLSAKIRKQLAFSGCYHPEIAGADHIELRFTQLPYLSNEETNFALAALTEDFQFPYFHLQSDIESEAAQKVIITFLWNPRQLLVDRLACDISELKTSTVVLPFTQEEFWDAVTDYELDILKSMGSKALNLQNAISQIKEIHSRDLFELIDRSPLVTRIPFSAVVVQNYRDLVAVLEELYADQIDQVFAAYLNGAAEYKYMNSICLPPEGKQTWGNQTISDVLKELTK